MTKSNLYAENVVECKCGWFRACFTEKLAKKLLCFHEKRCDLPETDDVIDYYNPEDMKQIDLLESQLKTIDKINSKRKSHQHQRFNFV